MKSVLVIDPSFVSRKLIIIFLNRLGYKAYESENAYAALKVLSEKNPDLILSEMNLPDINGSELCRKIRSEKRYNAPFIMLTTDSTDDSRFGATAAGCTDYVTKPVHVRTLYEILERNLEYHRRKHLRTVLSIPVGVRLGEEVRVYDTLTFGEGGLFLKTGDYMPVGTAVDLSFKLPVYDTLIETSAIITYVLRDDQHWHHPGIGVNYFNLDYRHRVLLSNFMEDYLMNSMARSKERELSEKEGAGVFEPVKVD